LERGRVRLLIRLVTAEDGTLSFRGTRPSAFGIGGLHRGRCGLGFIGDINGGGIDVRRFRS
jgi:hypothetical protein